MSKFIVVTALLFLLDINFVASFRNFDYCKGTSWIKFDGFCYLFNSKSELRMSYYDAEDFCRSLGAHLVSIHSEKENDFILNTMDKGGYGSRMWIGFNILDGDDKPRWSDDSPVNYEKRIKKDFYKNEKCFMMFTTKRGWRPEHCALHYLPICKRPENAEPTTIPPPSTIAPPTGYCPKDWIQFGQKCYRYFGHADKDRFQYKDARNACWKLGKNYNLASVHSMEEQAFLTQHLYDLGTSAWIGINYVESDEVGHDMVFGWVDNSRKDFEFWAKGHPPRGTWKNCGRLSYEGVNKGQWIADYCETKKRGYLCQRPSDPNFPVPVPEPPKCQEEFQNYRNSCYRFMAEAQTLDKAEEKCQEFGGHLTSVVDSFEQAFLHNYIPKETTLVGIGLQNVEGTRYLSWNDKQPVYYSNWGDGIPHLDTSSKSCFVIDTNNGFKWNTTNCSIKVPYVCKTSSDAPSKFLEIIGTCPESESSWIDIGDKFCYHVADSSYHISTWDAASRYCTSKGMKMISVHSDHEMNSLLTYSWTESKGVHLGLIRTFDKKSFMWVDGTQLNYTNWAEREPSSWSSSKDCAAFDQMTGKWAPIGCNEGGVTVCRIEKTIK